MANPEAPLAELWPQYVRTIQYLIAATSRSPSRRVFLRALKPFFDKTFEEAQDLRDELTVGWKEFESDQPNQRVAKLLSLELAGFINGIEALADKKFSDAITVEIIPSRQTDEGEGPKRNRITWNDKLRAGKTILESLIDILKDFLPPGVIGVLKALKEAAEIGAG